MTFGVTEEGGDHTFVPDIVLRDGDNVGGPGWRLDAVHTPGHTSFILSSGSRKLYIQSDVTNNPDLFARQPEWAANFDQDPVQAVATRRKVYDMLVAEKLLVQGFHYPFPGVAYVEKAGTAYRLVPTPWNPAI